MVKLTSNFITMSKLTIKLFKSRLFYYTPGSGYYEQYKGSEYNSLLLTSEFYQILTADYGISGYNN